MKIYYKHTINVVMISLLGVFAISLSFGRSFVCIYLAVEQSALLIGGLFFIFLFFCSFLFVSSFHLVFVQPLASNMICIDFSQSNSQTVYTFTFCEINQTYRFCYFKSFQIFGTFLSLNVQ